VEDSLTFRPAKNPIIWYSNSSCDYKCLLCLANGEVLDQILPQRCGSYSVIAQMHTKKWFWMDDMSKIWECFVFFRNQ